MWICDSPVSIISCLRNEIRFLTIAEPFWKELYANPLSPFNSKSLLEQNEIRDLARNVTKEVELADVQSRYDERKTKRELSARKREHEKRKSLRDYGLLSHHHRLQLI
jgi:hypothetical protein